MDCDNHRFFFSARGNILSRQQTIGILFAVEKTTMQLFTTKTSLFTTFNQSGWQSWR
jgi:hypothetical protein